MENIPEKKIENRRTRWGSFVFLFILLILTDQASKYLASDVYRNYYFAFSLPLNVYMMYGIYFLGIGAIAVYVARYHRALPKTEFVAWVLILAGAVSNVGERLFLSSVRDWIYIGNGVFNLADGYIIAGILILLLNPKSQTLNSKQISISKFKN